MQKGLDNKHMRLRKEIVLALLLKILGLFLLWACFFSHPIAKNIDLEKVKQHWVA